MTVDGRKLNVRSGKVYKVGGIERQYVFISSSRCDGAFHSKYLADSYTLRALSLDHLIIKQQRTFEQRFTNKPAGSSLPSSTATGTLQHSTTKVLLSRIHDSLFLASSGFTSNNQSWIFRMRFLHSISIAKARFSHTDLKIRKLFRKVFHYLWIKWLEPFQIDPF